MQTNFVSNQNQQERPGSWGQKKVEEEVRRLWGRGDFLVVEWIRICLPVHATSI